MKKVLIVDDEFLVRLGIKTSVDWNSFGYDIVGEASNGSEALQMVDQFDPDILITDIKMPDMDGIQLIAEVKKKEKKKIQFVILTNYGNFNYAQKAIQYGVSQYILKSEINSTELLNILKKLSVSDEAEENTLPAESKQEKYILRQIPNLNNSTISSSLFTVPEKGLFQAPPYSLLIASCDISQLEVNAVSSIEKMLRSLIDSCFPQSFQHSGLLQKRLVLAAIIPVKKTGSDAEFFKWLDFQGDMLIRNIRQYSTVDMTLGYSLTGGDDAFPELFTQAELARRTCFFNSKSIAVFRNELESDQDEPFKIDYNTVKSGLLNDSFDCLKKYITNCFDLLRSSLRFDYAKASYIDFLAAAKLFCNESKIDKSVLPFTKLDYESFSAMPNINMAEDYICNLYLQIFNIAHNSNWQYSHYIKSCIAFISKNYSQSITLNDVAKSANISNTYLSMIFKQEMRITFSEYLTNYRLGQAKNLLCTTSLHIYEIAEKVGFSSPYYFSHIFKSETGLSCKEYRDRFAKT